MAKIDFGELDLEKALVLAALYNGAKPSAKEIKKYDPQPMTVQEAKSIIFGRFGKENFDYIKGRTLLIIFVEKTFNAKLYNKNNGDGSAETIIESLVITGDINNDQIIKIHEKNVAKAIMEVNGKYSKKQ